MANADNDGVGYGKPPKQTRFTKGKSGNPKGRPKGSRNFDTDLEEALAALVTVTKNGMPRQVSSQKAAMMRLVEKALNGDTRSLETYLRLAREHSTEQLAKTQERRLTGSEDEILQRFEEDLLAQAGVARPAETHGAQGHDD